MIDLLWNMFEQQGSVSLYLFYRALQSQGEGMNENETISTKVSGDITPQKLSIY